MSVSRVLVPFVASVAPVRALQAIEAEWPDAYFVSIPAGDPGAFARFLLTAFRSQRSFCVVEHDMIPPPGSIERLLSCPHPWCGHAYSVGTHDATQALGLTAFRWDVYAMHSGSIEYALHDKRRPDGFRRWEQVSEELALRLRTGGMTWHRHEPDAGHLHDYRQIEAV